MSTAVTPLRATDKPVDNPPATAPAAVPGAPAKKQQRAPKVFAGLLALAAVVFLTSWLLGRGKESTDDAQVEGRLVGVSPRIAGQVERVLVRDNQEVQAGDILVVLDRRDAEARLAAAKADVAGARAQLAAAQAQLALTQANAAASLRQARGGVTQAASTVNATRSGLAQAKADLAAAEAAARLAETDLVRAKELRAQQTVPQSELDLREARAEQARAQLDQARARLETTEANLVASGGGVEVAGGRLASAQTAPRQIEAARAAQDAAAARVQLAEAQERLAELALGYTDVRAPVKGVVSRRSVEQGQLVDPSRPMLALVPLDDVWVVANFKEDQIGKMKPGQKAKVHVDAFNRDFDARVDSLSGASGARFALLPPDNASGNFIKVVQRLPVLLRFEPLPAGVSRDVILRPGLSAEVTVVTE
jgi:membrane fusion protein (multidrug efflux system)